MNGDEALEPGTDRAGAASLPDDDESAFEGHGDVGFEVLAAGGVDGHFREAFSAVIVEAASANLKFEGVGGWKSGDAFEGAVVFPADDEVSFGVHGDGWLELLAFGNGVDDDVAELLAAVGVEAAGVDLVVAVHVLIVFPDDDEITVWRDGDAWLELLS